MDREIVYIIFCENGLYYGGTYRALDNNVELVKKLSEAKWYDDSDTAYNTALELSEKTGKKFRFKSMLLSV